jgi:hypothetical protein
MIMTGMDRAPPACEEERGGMLFVPERRRSRRAPKARSARSEQSERSNQAVIPVALKRDGPP